MFPTGVSVLGDPSVAESAMGEVTHYANKTSFMRRQSGLDFLYKTFALENGGVTHIVENAYVRLVYVDVRGVAAEEDGRRPGASDDEPVHGLLVLFGEGDGGFVPSSSDGTKLLPASAAPSRVGHPRYWRRGASRQAVYSWDGATVLRKGARTAPAPGWTVAAAWEFGGQRHLLLTKAGSRTALPVAEGDERWENTHHVQIVTYDREAGFAVKASHTFAWYEAATYVEIPGVMTGHVRTVEGTTPVVFAAPSSDGANVAAVTSSLPEPYRTSVQSVLSWTLPDYALTVESAKQIVAEVPFVTPDAPAPTTAVFYHGYPPAPDPEHPTQYHRYGPDGGGGGDGTANSLLRYYDTRDGYVVSQVYQYAWANNAPGDNYTIYDANYDVVTHFEFWDAPWEVGATTRRQGFLGAVPETHEARYTLDKGVLLSGEETSLSVRRDESYVHRSSVVDVTLNYTGAVGFRSTNGWKVSTAPAPWDAPGIGQDYVTIVSASGVSTGTFASDYVFEVDGSPVYTAPFFRGTYRSEDIAVLGGPGPYNQSNTVDYNLLDSCDYTFNELLFHDMKTGVLVTRELHVVGSGHGLPDWGVAYELSARLMLSAPGHPPLALLQTEVRDFEDVGEAWCVLPSPQLYDERWAWMWDNTDNFGSYPWTTSFASPPPVRDANAFTMIKAACLALDKGGYSLAMVFSDADLTGGEVRTLIVSNGQLVKTTSAEASLVGIV